MLNSVVRYDVKNVVTLELCACAFGWGMPVRLLDDSSEARFECLAASGLIGCGNERMSEKQQASDGRADE